MQAKINSQNYKAELGRIFETHTLKCNVISSGTKVMQKYLKVLVNNARPVTASATQCSKEEQYIGAI